MQPSQKLTSVLLALIVAVGVSSQQTRRSHVYFDVTFLQSSCEEKAVLDVVDQVPTNRSISLLDQLNGLLNDVLICTRCAKLYALNQCGEDQIVATYRVSDRGLTTQNLQIFYNTLKLVPRCFIEKLGFSGNVLIDGIKIESDYIMQGDDLDLLVLPICDDFLLEEFDSLDNLIEPAFEK